jgi:hypothetical protein
MNERTDTQLHGDALRKEVRVALDPEAAFRLYTEGIATWWPLATHSVEEENAETVVFEPGVGGRIVERSRQGVEHHWGTVLEWEPFERFVHTWHPGRAEATGQVVEVRFVPDGTGTSVELVHTGWDALGGLASDRYAGYDAGWNYVLGERFAAAAAA